MALALLDPIGDYLRSSLKDAGNRATIGVAKSALLVVAAGLALSGGIVALSRLVGYPIAALVFAGLCAVLALVVHLLGRKAADRQAQRIARAKGRASHDLAVATSLARSASPLVPLAAFVAAFVLARRR